MVMKMYGEEAFFEDALNILYPETVDAAIKESGLNVINDKMDFDMVSISKEDGVDFKIAVTTYPEIEIGEYKGLKAEKVIAKVEDSEIDAQVKSMADRNARMVTHESGTLFRVLDFPHEIDNQQRDNHGYKGDQKPHVVSAQHFQVTAQIVHDSICAPVPFVFLVHL